MSLIEEFEKYVESTDAINVVRLAQHQYELGPDKMIVLEDHPIYGERIIVEFSENRAVHPGKLRHVCTSLEEFKKFHIENAVNNATLSEELSAIEKDTSTASSSKTSKYELYFNQYPGEASGIVTYQTNIEGERLEYDYYFTIHDNLIVLGHDPYRHFAFSSYDTLKKFISASAIEQHEEKLKLHSLLRAIHQIYGKSDPEFVKNIGSNLLYKAFHVPIKANAPQAQRENIKTASARSSLSVSSTKDKDGSELDSEVDIPSAVASRKSSDMSDATRRSRLSSRSHRGEYQSIDELLTARLLNDPNVGIAERGILGDPAYTEQPDEASAKSFGDFKYALTTHADKYKLIVWTQKRRHQAYEVIFTTQNDRIKFEKGRYAIEKDCPGIIDHVFKQNEHVFDHLIKRQGKALDELRKHHSRERDRLQQYQTNIIKVLHAIEPNIEKRAWQNDYRYGAIIARPDYTSGFNSLADFKKSLSHLDIWPYSAYVICPRQSDDEYPLVLFVKNPKGQYREYPLRLVDNHIMLKSTEEIECDGIPAILRFNDLKPQDMMPRSRIKLITDELEKSELISRPPSDDKSDDYTINYPSW